MEKPTETSKEKASIPHLSLIPPFLRNTHIYSVLHLVGLLNKCQISKISRQIKGEPHLDPGKRDPNFKGSHT